MNLKIQKILAREFLIVMICFIVPIVFYTYFSLSNFYINKKIDRLHKTEIVYRNIKDSLSKKLQLQSDTQQLLTNHYNNYLGEIGYATLTNDELWGRLKYLAEVDSITIKWNTIWSYEKIAFVRFDFKSPLEFQKFIVNNIPNVTVINQNESLLNTIHNKELSISANLKSNTSKSEMALFAFYISITLMFGLRYLVYASKWSYRTLLKKN